MDSKYVALEPFKVLYRTFSSKSVCIKPIKSQTGDISLVCQSEQWKCNAYRKAN